jgi:hypothetical protein
MVAPDLDVPTLDALVDLRERLEGEGTQTWFVTEVDLVHDQMQSAGLSDPGSQLVYREATGALLAYLSLHFSSGADGHRAVLEDILAGASGKSSLLPQPSWS